MDHLELDTGPVHLWSVGSSSTFFLVVVSMAVASVCCGLCVDIYNVMLAPVAKSSMLIQREVKKNDIVISKSYMFIKIVNRRTCIFIVCFEC